MNTLKKYRIHILGIRAFNYDVFDLPQENNAVIVCTPRRNENIYACNPQNVLLMDFQDCENPFLPGAFNKTHARIIISFLKNISNEVTDIYVCCSKGGSRSPAVAASILRMSGRSDRDVWLNPYYVPNILVYTRLCREYGLFTPLLSVMVRKIFNNLSFKISQKKGTRYERWQILE